MTLNNKQMDASVDAAEADTQAAIARMNEEMRNVARRLMDIHQKLEREGKVNSVEWTKARQLEELIGSGQLSQKYLDEAKLFLLANHS